ncbi:methionyl-tRNA formyltransferase [Hydrogenimonas sp.]
MGTPDYAEKILAALLADDVFDVVAVFTQPDRPVGRKKVLTAPPVKRLALEAGVPVHQPDSLKEAGVAEEIAAYRPEYIVVAAYGMLLPPSILRIAPCINLHASLLPRYRGASPIQEALLHGDSETGVTAMLMEEGLDSGPVLAWRVREIPLSMRKLELFERLAGDAASLTPAVLKGFGAIRPLPQCDAEATYCHKIRRGDGEVDFTMPARAIYNRFRAYEGWPGIFLPSGLKLLDVALADGEPGAKPGEILRLEEDGIVVACGEGALKIRQVQPPSKKAMEALSYIRGKRLDVADSLL